MTDRSRPVCTFQWYRDEHSDELMICGRPAVETCGAMGACSQHVKDGVWWNCVRAEGGIAKRIRREYAYGKRRE